MREVQSTEAKARLAELLRTVERGETIAITRHGKVVAYLTPPAEPGAANHKEAVMRFRQYLHMPRAAGTPTSEILEMRHDGHAR